MILKLVWLLYELAHIINCRYSTMQQKVQNIHRYLHVADVTDTCGQELFPAPYRMYQGHLCKSKDAAACVYKGLSIHYD